ncbi:putative ATP-grasp superfamily ATP-dependent carboligase [Allocatelliglobosispora scoriae]|uniref:Putative ATP-grasp superfamily ATP-dependent carboligase n=1 Tax=Allocatelliglobosispora scoriae TaxID=643052 RepID=A0A841BNW6_9ACTN|nr:ATP-grasp domain-containing protein [Allocatelliglobosispora scoriae]MBB5868889.1 putative ATP-grasp superfamily ATP-dependent carboligase [Allocatelliglobosispora scoriae]
MTWDLHDYRLVTASAYPGMMAPLTQHPSCICVLSGDADRTINGPVAGLSLEALDGVRRRWRFGDVARLADFVPKVLADAPRDDRPILLVPPRASTAWESAAAAWPGRVRVAASPIAVVDPIAEDKAHVREALRRLGVPVPEAVVLTPDAMGFAAIEERLGSPFVVQSPNGAGGQGTYLVTDPAGLATALTAHPHVERWLVSAFAGDTTINVAGIVHVDGTQLLPISVQASGIAELGFEFGAYCGSDFGAAAVAAAVREEAFQHAATIGEWLREQGHLGIFGVDISVSGRTLSVLEVNPRIQGSSWLLSRLEGERGGPSCLEQHLQALLGRPLGATTRPAAQVNPGSHLIMRWSGPPVVVREVPAASAAVSALPKAGITMLPGAILARFTGDGQLAGDDGRSLRATTTSLVERVRSGFEFTLAKM